MQNKRYLTKSAFKVALSCPHKLYYYAHPEEYENANANDEFLESLAEGGFQVGELAKIYCDVPADCDLKDVMDHEESLKRTQELMQRDEVNIAEAAFCFGDLFVRVDILKKRGHDIELIEVKAKSWNPETDHFISSKPKGAVMSAIRPYVYDIAFQKYVVVNALKQMYPNEHYSVKAFLMMADKSKKADIDGLNQLFKIVKNKQGRAEAVMVPDARERIAQSHVQVVNAFDVDDVCETVIAGETTEQKQDKNPTCEGMGFVPFIQYVSSFYPQGQPCPMPVTLGGKCLKCEFHCTAECDLKDGCRQCWLNHVSEHDLDNRPLIATLNGSSLSTNRSKWVSDGIYFMDQLTEQELKPYNEKKADEPGLDDYQRKWLQIGLETNNQELLSRFSNGLKDHTYLDVEGLRQEMATWRYPLHMIDFETTAVALPYYIGMKPYEQVAFQFSHHIIREDGTIEHAGQYLNEDVSRFPNFEFVRELRRQLSQDEGTIFRYATHENSILRAISRQLSDSNEADKDELIAFIRSITHNNDDKKGEEIYQGERDMVDLLQVVKRYFYQLDEMHGSNSIKQVLPAVLNTSDYLKQKYSQPIYGSMIKSQNIPKDNPLAWIQMDANGHVESPYHLLPSVGQLIDMSEEDMAQMELLSTDEKEFEVANGGAALTAYSKLMFTSDLQMTDALREALLRYCELDTMSMVFIWEYFRQSI